MYRELGHEADARKVAIAKQQALRKKGGLSPTGWVWNRLLGFLVGYGYRPWLVLFPALFVIVLGAVVFGVADDSGLMVPASARYLDPAVDLPAAYPFFSPLGYSIDAFVPILDLRQQVFWVPSGEGGWGLALWIYMWVHIALGWILTTIFVLGFTGVVRKD